MNKLFKLEKELNEIEKKTGKASYKTVVERFCKSLLLCNNIIEIDPDILCNIEVGDLADYMDINENYYTREEYENDTTGKIYEEYVEIYQYYLTDLNKWDIEYLQELEKRNNDNSIIIAYSEKLDLYVLLVTHFGTSWDYVETQIELTGNYNEI